MENIKFLAGGPVISTRIFMHFGTVKVLCEMSSSHTRVMKDIDGYRVVWVIYTNRPIPCMKQQQECPGSSYFCSWKILMATECLSDLLLKLIHVHIINILFLAGGPVKLILRDDIHRFGTVVLCEMSVHTQCHERYWWLQSVWVIYC